MKVQQRISANHESRRAGLTLLEVLISRAAVQTQLRTQAIFRCQSVLAEVLAGAQPMESVAMSAFDDESENWKWSLNVEPGDYENMLKLTVLVQYIGDSETVSTSYQLIRQVRDPAMLLDAANTVETTTDTTLEDQL